MNNSSLTPNGRNDGHQFDYTQVTDQLFIGSDLCKAGVCLLHAEEFRQLDVSVELNLSQEENELPPKEIDVYSWLPVTDGYSPTQLQFDIGTSIINDSIADGKKVYVHCKNGHGRSPSMIAAYFVKYKGYKLENAIELIKELRPESHIEETQISELKEFEKRWSK